MAAGRRGCRGPSSRICRPIGSTGRETRASDIPGYPAPLTTGTHSHGGNLYADVPAEAQRRPAEVLARLGMEG